jgi:hypothetical protein
MIVRFDVEGYNPSVADIDYTSVEPRSDKNSWPFAGELFEEWFAGFVAAMLRPLRFEHSPLNLVRLALELLDRVPDFLVCEIGLPNL